jgi:hypothetical protein
VALLHHVGAELAQRVELDGDGEADHAPCGAEHPGQLVVCGRGLRLATEIDGQVNQAVRFGRRRGGVHQTAEHHRADHLPIGRPLDRAHGVVGQRGQRAVGAAQHGEPERVAGHGQGVEVGGTNHQRLLTSAQLAVIALQTDAALVEHLEGRRLLEVSGIMCHVSS